MSQKLTLDEQRMEFIRLVEAGTPPLFTVAGELLFLSPLIDLFKGEVLSYRLDTNQGMTVVLGMLRDALPQVRRAITMLHSDRGWQYQHAGFRRALRKAEITQSMSRSGNCYDNACAENFFSHFKQESLRGRMFGSIDDFEIQFSGWIAWFNNARLSEKRGWTSPRGYSIASPPTPTSGNPSRTAARPPVNPPNSAQRSGRGALS
jgi:putative transposase